MAITPEMFDAQRSRRFGSTNPERMRLEFWESLPESERPLPVVPPALVDKLKFSEALPVEWAVEVIARRMVAEE